VSESKHNVPEAAQPGVEPDGHRHDTTAVAQALGPVLEQIAEMTIKIKQYDRQIQQLAQTEYAETQALLKSHDVGHITAPMDVGASH